jgi:Family of unknown function (DUF6152)
MRTKLLGMVAGAGLLLSVGSAPVLAHHSFAAEFDAHSPVTLEGTVKEFKWVNPHSWLVINVEKKNGEPISKDGSTQVWSVEGGAPSALLRRGWNRNSLPPGTKVVVSGFMAKDGSPRANARDVTFPNGEKLFIGSSGIGAPDEQDHPRD